MTPRTHEARKWLAENEEETYHLRLLALDAAAQGNHTARVMWEEKANTLRDAIDSLRRVFCWVEDEACRLGPEQ